MLEGRKLSLEMQRDSNSRVWTVLALLISSACILLLASLWIGFAIAPPPQDKSQDNMAQAHAKVLEGMAQLKSSLAADQTITPELISDMALWVPVLADFSQASAFKLPQIHAIPKFGLAGPILFWKISTPSSWPKSLCSIFCAPATI